MKKCFKCGELKPLDEFYRHPQMADGHLNKCKTCNKADVSNNYRDNIDHYKEYERSRMRLPHRKAAVKAYAIKNRDAIDVWKKAYSKENRVKINLAHKRYSKRHPLKRLAHYMVSNAIRDGRLIRKPCEECGELKVEAHHADYYKPIDVNWLCKIHHLARHGKVSHA